VRYISRRDGKSSAQLIPISKGFPDLSVLVIRSGLILSFFKCPSKTIESKTHSRHRTLGGVYGSQHSSARKRMIIPWLLFLEILIILLYCVLASVHHLSVRGELFCLEPRALPYALCDFDVQIGGLSLKSASFFQK
jgi:hypothetical protein